MTNPLATLRTQVAKDLAPLFPTIAIEKVQEALERGKEQSTEEITFCLILPRITKDVKGISAGVEEKFKPTFTVSSIKLSGAFLSISLVKSEVIKHFLNAFLPNASTYGENTSGSSKKQIIVEYSSPNVAKPFHAGHLRSTIIGNFVANAHKANGYKVTRINYLGDWGKQYGLLAIGFNMFGSETELKTDPIHHLFEIYVRINKEKEANPNIDDQARAYFKKMEDGDTAALELWERFRQLSIEAYKKMYLKLGVSFDVYSGESQVTEPMHRALERLKEMGLLTHSEGAVLVDLEKYKLNKTLIQKKDGTSLYLTRDIGAAWERYEKYNFEKMYYIVGTPQELHFKQLFKTLELLDFPWAKDCVHINFGSVRGMKSRTGEVVFLDDIINDSANMMHDVMKRNVEKYEKVTDPEATAANIGVSAVMIQDMGAKRVKDYTFNMDRCFNFEGDTGPFLQYSHARLFSILAKYTTEEKPANWPPTEINETMMKEFENPAVLNLLRDLLYFPDVVHVLLKGFEPCTMLTYLFTICHTVASTYESIYVAGQTADVAYARATLYYAAQTVVAHGMKILGLTPLERM